MSDLLKTLPEIDPAEMARLEAQWAAEASRPRPTLDAALQAAFPTTGLRPLKTEPMPPSTALTQTPRPRTSATTGALKPGLSPASLIGALRGGPGAVAALNLPPAYQLPLSEPIEERVCRHMQALVKASQTPSKSEMRCVAETLQTAWGPTCRTRDETIAGLLRVFFGHFPRQGGADRMVEAMVASDWLDDLAEYPLFAIREALRRGRLAGREFRPAIGEVRAWAQSYSRKYRELRDEFDARGRSHDQ